MIPYLDKTIVKITLLITLVGLLIGVFKWYHGFVFDAGADSVRASIAAEYVEREKELTDKLNKLKAAKDIETGKATVLQGKLTKSQNDARKLRDKINDAVFDCDVIGGDFGDLWNESSKKPSE